MNKLNSHVVSEQVTDQKEPTQPDSKMPFLEPTVSTPEDVLEATTFFQAPTVDTTTV
ncbi:MAG: hypothetical protein M3447_05550 [Acidobacteriota bacterium]|nr:hypothetical protein [Acidobacteriota bacterium]